MSDYKILKCDAISLDHVGEKVQIRGWVQTIRDLGGLVFLDIRDMYGITQVVTSGEAKDVDFASHILFYINLPNLSILIQKINNRNKE